MTDVGRAPGRSRTRWNRVLRVAEGVCAAAGLACLLIYAAACARTALSQHEAAAHFEHALRQRLALEAPDTREWSPARIERWEASRAEGVAPLARLEIPDIDLSVMVLEGTDDNVLDRAVGWIEATARPGEPGNLGIAGHRDGYFRPLRHLDLGAELVLTSLAGVGRYEVSSLEVVDPSRVDVLAPGDGSEITLVTCHPFYFVGEAPERYIVKARQHSFTPWSREHPPQLAER